MKFNSSRAIFNENYYLNIPVIQRCIRVACGIRFDIKESISQPAMTASRINTKWQWSPVDKAKSSRRYLTAAAFRTKPVLVQFSC